MREIIKNYVGSCRMDIKCILTVPDEYNEHFDKKLYPAIVFLHRAGEQGSGLDDIKKAGIHHYLKKKGIPFVIISPQCPEGIFWDVHFKEIETILQTMINNNYHIDEERIHLIGIGLGAYGVWNFAIQKPEMFASIVPIAGGVMFPKYLSRVKDIPAWVFHGEKDEIVPVEESLKAIDSFKKAGGIVKQTIIKDVGHELCDIVFENEELYTWLLEQRKTSSRPSLVSVGG